MLYEGLHFYLLIIRIPAFEENFLEKHSFNCKPPLWNMEPNNIKLLIFICDAAQSYNRSFSSSPYLQWDCEPGYP